MTRQLSLVLVLSVGLIVIVAALWIAAPALGSDLNPAAAAPGRVALTPPPEPLAVDKLEVAEIIELPLLAGPGASSAHLSPDGERLAYFRWKTLCILEIDAMAGYVQAALDAGVDLDNYLAAPNAFEGIDCISLEGIFNGPIEQEGVWWSPDGRYLVMSPDFFRMFYEPDIWVFDTTTLTLANIPTMAKTSST
jgi:hypothetical protein